MYICVIICNRNQTSQECWKKIEIRWDGSAARPEACEIYTKFLLDNRERRDSLHDPDVHWRIILDWIASGQKADWIHPPYIWFNNPFNIILWFWQTADNFRKHLFNFLWRCVPTRVTHSETPLSVVLLWTRDQIFLFFIVAPCILITSKFFSQTNAPFY